MSTTFSAEQPSAGQASVLSSTHSSSMDPRCSPLKQISLTIITAQLTFVHDSLRISPSKINNNMAVSPYIVAQAALRPSRCIFVYKLVTSNCWFLRIIL
ncbi:MAG: hypothetical protein NWQ54_16930 [Paraglaciecola sp.]|nr:hypothetical protein [Paraglaciecola sp.]